MLIICFQQEILPPQPLLYYVKCTADTIPSLSARPREAIGDPSETASSVLIYLLFTLKNSVLFNKC